MRWQAFVGIVLAAVLGVMILAMRSGGAAAQAQGAKRPNFVVIMTDDQTAPSLRVMNSVKRELIDRGTVFPNFFNTFPLCCPSRATFLNGQYAHNHGVLGDRAPTGGFKGFDDSDTLSVALERSGFRTAWIGKYLNGYPRFGKQHLRFKPPGWSRWYADLKPGRMFDWVLNDNGRTHKYTDQSDYKTDVLARKAAEFIRRSASRRRPFFMTVAPPVPHGEPGLGRGLNPRPAPRHRGIFRHEPLPTPPSFNEADVSDKPSFVRELPPIDHEARQHLRLRNRARLESLLAVDDMVAKIMATLRKEDQLGDTYVVFTTDNGFLLGEHRLIGKVKLYEPSVRMPLIIRGPGVPKGVERTQITGNIDLAPTIVDATGVAALNVMDGVSLLPAADDPSIGSDRDIVLENRVSAAVRTPDFMYAEHDVDRDLAPDEYELYDLEADPHQLRNRYGDPGFASITSQLEQRLDQLRDCAGASCR